MIPLDTNEFSHFTLILTIPFIHDPQLEGRSTRTQTIGSTINWSTNGAGISNRRIERFTSELIEVSHNEFVPANNTFVDEPL